MRRESDELFVKELIPPLIFSLAFEVSIEGGISDLVAIREELMIATKNGKWLIGRGSPTLNFGFPICFQKPKLSRNKKFSFHLIT